MKAKVTRFARSDRGLAGLLFSLALVVAIPSIVWLGSSSTTTVAESQGIGTGSAAIPLSVDQDQVVSHYLSDRVAPEASRSRHISMAVNVSEQLNRVRVAVARAHVDSTSVVQIASRYEGVRYRMGGSSPRGFDCSGYTKYVFAQLGYTLPRVADEQYRWATQVAHGDAKPGDLVFFHQGNGYVYHVGIYAGNNQVWHAPYPGRSVEKSALFGTVTFGKLPAEVVDALYAHKLQVIEGAFAAKLRGIPA